jgi:thiol-disulfide isomerase/thioredoxin
VLVLLTLAVTGCGRDQPASSLVGTSVIDVADRQSLPPVSGTTLDGTPLDVSELAGRVVVLNNWASWCGPCRDEVPGLVSLAGSVDSAKVAVVGLDVSDDSAAAKAFARELGMTYPSIVDADGALLRTIPGVPPSALPSTVILDRQGRIAVRIVGPVDPVALPGLVDGIVAEG